MPQGGRAHRLARVAFVRYNSGRASEPVRSFALEYPLHRS